MRVIKASQRTAMGVQTRIAMRPRGCYDCLWRNYKDCNGGKENKDNEGVNCPVWEWAYE